MEENRNNHFWKGFLIGAVCFFIIGALAVFGLTRLLKGLAGRVSGTETTAVSTEVKNSDETTALPSPSVTRPSDQTGTTAVPASTEEPAAPTSTKEGQTATQTQAPETTGTETPEGLHIDWTQNRMLMMLNGIELMYTGNQVLPYNLDEMHEAALKAYVEAAGKNWEEVKDTHPAFTDRDEVIKWDSAFLNRMGELTILFPASSEEEALEWEKTVCSAFVEAGGDIYSAYLTPEEWASMQESQSGSYCGVGIQIQQNLETMEVTVIRVFSNGPAKEAGFLEGDILKAVDGVDVSEMPVDLLVTYVRGEEHTYVTVTVYRPSTGETLEIRCERRVVEVDTVYARMLNDTTGYIELTEFDDVSVSQVRTAINELKRAGMTSLVFDLRNNPGGLLSSVLDIADYFIERGKLLFRMDYQSGEVYTESAVTNPIFTGGMVVLINENSASASEVLTGIMQDYGRATIMGTKSFGKGIVQGFFGLPFDSVLKVTIAHYYSPAGRDFHGIGISPDIEGEDKPETEIDELLEQAIEQLQ